MQSYNELLVLALGLAVTLPPLELLRRRRQRRQKFLRQLRELLG